MAGLKLPGQLKQIWVTIAASLYFKPALFGENRLKFFRWTFAASSSPDRGGGQFEREPDPSWRNWYNERITKSKQFSPSTAKHKSQSFSTFTTQVSWNLNPQETLLMNEMKSVSQFWKYSVQGPPTHPCWSPVKWGKIILNCPTSWNDTCIFKPSNPVVEILVEFETGLCL